MSNKKEFAIGEEVKVGILTVICVEEIDNCRDCAFLDMRNSEYVYCTRYVGDCVGKYRTDGKDVIFKLKEE